MTTVEQLTKHNTAQHNKTNTHTHRHTHAKQVKQNKAEMKKEHKNLQNKL